MPPDVQIPSAAVSATADIGAPTTELLHRLNLLPKTEDLAKADGFVAAFSGPPQSVAIIEAGATALTKWWAAGLGVGVVATWGTVGAWWGTQPVAIKVAVVVGAAILTAALVIALGHVISSDVRGRAAATVSLVEARATVAMTMIGAAERVHKPAPSEQAPQLVPLPSPLPVKLLKGPDEEGWLAVAIERQTDGSIKYIAVKGSREEAVAISDLVVATPATPVTGSTP